MTKESLVCPFCSLLCDDLRVDVQDGQARVLAQGCERARRLFPVPGTAAAVIDGRPADPRDALLHAARLLARSRRPLLSGLGCDIHGLRAAVRLAERAGAHLDHMHAAAQLRNVLSLRRGGSVLTTLSELRNRADVVLMAGTVAGGSPRLFERCLGPDAQGLFGELHRRVLVVGSPLLRPPQWPAGAELAIECANEALPELFGLLRARAAGAQPRVREWRGIDMRRIDELLDTLRGARYGVLVWDAAELDHADADLTVRAMLDLVTELNANTRWSALPLGGDDGGASAQQVCTWLAGYPLRMGFVDGVARSDPRQRTTSQLLEQQDCDLLLWISALDPARLPPRAACPTIVLGRADMQPPAGVEVFLPVAVPGVQAPGALTRVDQVVTLPLAAPAPAALPGVAEVLGQMQRMHQELRHAAA